MWNGLIYCDQCKKKDNSIKRTLIRCSRFIFIFYIGWLLPLCEADCPELDLQERAFRCFDRFSSQKVHLDKSGSRLFSGIDTEVLRVFCSSYIEAMTCIRNLMERCPEDTHKDISIALVNLRGMDQELQDLCLTNGLYEKYAPKMNCFMDRGHKSDWCFDRSLNGSYNDLPLEDLCSRMREVTLCIENNIRQGCGEEAAELVHLLVKPMVRRSGSCTYNVYHEENISTTKEGTESSNTPNKHVHKPHNSSRNLISNVLYLILCLKLTFLPYIFR